MNLFDLSGKVAIITGSSRGIGRAIAEQMAAHGARVVISSRKQDACEPVAAAIRARGGQALAVAANIGDKQQLTDLVNKTVAAWGRIDVVVSNAASNPYYGPLSGMGDEVFEKVMNNNVRASIWLANLALPGMAQRGGGEGGAMIIISSIAAFKGSATLGLYALSKAADVQLARNLALEWGKHNIRVNCIAPGLVRTDFAKALWENAALLKDTEARTPLRRIGEPEDIAGVAVMLASRAGAWLTGQTIVVDGGVTTI
jgi:NAD(P)-dependent dehydrogenase (short-subunit alcohol dehydrogenase family)